MKYCRHCGNEMKDEATVCTKCGIAEKTPVTSEVAYCKSCGAEMKGKAAVCVKCGMAQTNGGNSWASSNNNSDVNLNSLARSRDGKILAGVCSGIGKKLNMNPWIIRAILIFCNFIFVGWFLDIAYVIAIFALPLED